MRSCVIMADNRQLRMPRSFHCILLFSPLSLFPILVFHAKNQTRQRQIRTCCCLSICVKNANASSSSSNLWHNNRITLSSAFLRISKGEWETSMFVGRVKTISDRCRSASQSFQSFRHAKGWQRLNVEQHQKENEKFHLRVMNIISDDFSLNFLFSSF